MRSNFYIRDYFLGIIVFLLPLFLYLRPNNLKQLSNHDIYIFIISLIVFLLFIFFLSLITGFFIKKIFKVKNDLIFLFICFGFYIIFFYDYLLKIILNYTNYYSSKIAVLVIFSGWLILFILLIISNRFQIFFKRSLFFFALIVIFFSLLNNLIYFGNALFTKQKHPTDHVNNKLLIDDIDITLINKKKYNNIYYIISDAMIALSLAEDLKIIDNKNEIKNNLFLNNLIYIDDSHSSYENTRLSLASIMKIDYHLTDENVPLDFIKNNFSSLMYQDKYKVPLTDLIHKFGGKFTWVGNNWGPCIEMVGQSWECTHNDFTRNIMRLSNSFYASTPLNDLLKKIIFKLNRERYIFGSFINKSFIYLEGKRNLRDYMNNILVKIEKNNSQFTFIHSGIPHPPYNVTSECLDLFDKKFRFGSKDYKINFKRYSESYKCVLNEINLFMKLISIHDPDALVVFQGDHGVARFDKNTSYILNQRPTKSKNQFLYQSSIFNAIKAPDSCFKKFSFPQTNVNTIRFVLNCAYNLEIPFRANMHYQFNDFTNVSDFLSEESGIKLIKF